MADPRLRSVLAQLTDLTAAPEPPRWRWRVVDLESVGRIRLPAAARAVLGAGRVRARTRQGALFLQVDGPGMAVAIDSRDRLLVPVWLRRAATTGELLVGTHTDRSLVIVTPAEVLDDSGDRFIAGPG